MWKITKNIIDGKGSPVFASADWNEKKSKQLAAKGKMFKFRMGDGDEKIYYYGISTDCDSEAAFDPLDDFGAASGCTYIEYQNKEGLWELL